MFSASKTLHDSVERQQQIEEGARLAREEGVTPVLQRTTLKLKSGARSSAAPKKEQPKGHEAFLKALETSGASIIVEKCDGTVVKGVVKHSDKYTITLRAPINGAPEMTIDRVVFKHDISEFSPATPRPAVKEEACL